MDEKTEKLYTPHFCSRGIKFLTAAFPCIGHFHLCSGLSSFGELLAWDLPRKRKDQRKKSKHQRNLPPNCLLCVNLTRAAWHLTGLYVIILTYIFDCYHGYGRSCFSNLIKFFLLPSKYIFCILVWMLLMRHYFSKYADRQTSILTPYVLNTLLYNLGSACMYKKHVFLAVNVSLFCLFKSAAYLLCVKTSSS